MSFSSSFQGGTDHTQNPVQICLNFSLASLSLVQMKQLIYFILLLPPLHLVSSGTPAATRLTTAVTESTVPVKHKASTGTQLLNLQ